MKKLIYLTAIAGLIVAGFAGCNKDEDPFKDLQTNPFDGNIIAQVVEGNQYNSVVKYVIMPIQKMIPFSVQPVFGEYADGGFTLTLPSPLGPEYLISFEDVDLPAGVKISDKAAQMAEVEAVVLGITSDNQPVEMFAYIGQNNFQGNMFPDRNNRDHIRYVCVYR